uniref:Protein FAM114A2 n=1 Tax=Ascaris lumbricoides TaxID=6252 RepID=A0A0M3I8M8_ASCLU
MSESDSDSFHSASEGEYFDERESTCNNNQLNEEIIAESTDIFSAFHRSQCDDKADITENCAIANSDNAVESFISLKVRELSTSETEDNFTKIAEVISSSATISRDNSAFEMTNREHLQRYDEDGEGKDKGSDSGGKSDSKSNKSDGWDEWDDERQLDHSEEDAASGWEKWDVLDSERSGQPIFDDEKSPTSANKSDDADECAKLKQSSDQKKNTEEASRSSLWSWTDISGAVAAVGEGISSVVESSLGLPSPEEVAKQQAERSEQKRESIEGKATEGSSVSQSLFGGFIAGVGSNIVTGSLDVLESLGKKTFEKLTVRKEGSARRRFIFEQDEGENLSDVLKELRDSCRLEKSTDPSSGSSLQANRDANYIDLFEKYGGFVHLEGLEMLSDNFLKRLSAEQKREMHSVLKEALSEGMVDSYEDEDFTNELNRILAEIGLPYNGAHLSECEKRCRQKCRMPPMDARNAFTDFLEVVAELTANSVQTMHKLGQVMLIGVRRPSERPLSNLLALIGRRLSFFSNEYADHLNSLNDCNENVRFL